jgi:hypothetical protein
MAKVTLRNREPTHVQSAARAFEIYVAGGGRHGYDVADRFEAERQLKLSFSRRGPPSSGLKRRAAPGIDPATADTSTCSAQPWLFAQPIHSQNKGAQSCFFWQTVNRTSEGAGGASRSGDGSNLDDEAEMCAVAGEMLEEALCDL